MILSAPGTITLSGISETTLVILFSVGAVAFISVFWIIRPRKIDVVNRNETQIRPHSDDSRNGDDDTIVLRPRDKELPEATSDIDDSS